jgi:hypothetical protein
MTDGSFLKSCGSSQRHPLSSLFGVNIQIDRKFSPAISVGGRNKVDCAYLSFPEQEIGGCF